MVPRQTWTPFTRPTTRPSTRTSQLTVAGGSGGGDAGVASWFSGSLGSEKGGINAAGSGPGSAAWAVSRTAVSRGGVVIVSRNPPYLAGGSVTSRPRVSV